MNNKKQIKITFTFKNEMEVMYFYDVIGSRIYSVNKQIPGYELWMESKKKKDNWDAKKWMTWFKGVHQLDSIKIVLKRQNELRTMLNRWRKQFDKQQPNANKNIKDYFEKEREKFAITRNESISLIEDVDWGIKGNPFKGIKK